MPLQALVTGGTGFVGSHVVEALLTRGYRVRCLVRATSSLSWLPTEGVDLLEGTLSEPERLLAAAHDVDIVVHSGGVVRSGDEAAAYDRVNVKGTRNLVEALERAAPGLKRLVYVSSLAAGGPSRPEHPRREEDPDQPISAYGRSKKQGEAELGTHVPWTILRPSAVYGPRDRGFLVLARLARRGFSFRLGGPPQPVNILHVRDLVLGVLSAIEEPRAIGRTYYLAHPKVTQWDSVGRIMARTMGRGTRSLVVPRWVVPIVGRGLDIGSRMLGQPNRLPADRLRDLLARGWTCTSDRAATELGFRAAVDLEPGFEETMAWYRNVGWL